MLDLLQNYGLWGLFFGTFLSATIVPFSSDLLYAAILAVTHRPIACLIIGTLGNWLGGLTSYGIGWLGRWEWIEKVFHVHRFTIEKHRWRISKFGYWLALLTWLPFVGDVFAIALGFYRIRPVPTFLFMLVGKFLRFLIWTLFFL